MGTHFKIFLYFLLVLCFITQFQQSVSSEVKCLGRSSFTLCVNSPLVIRQALHPEASKKVCVISFKLLFPLFVFLVIHLTQDGVSITFSSEFSLLFIFVCW